MDSSMPCARDEQYIETAVLKRLNQPENIIVPAILPDELAHGYVGRIRAVNALPHFNSAIALAETIFLNGAQAPSKARRAYATAKAAGVTLEQFCQQHTLMPFLRVTTNISPDLVHGAPEGITLLEKSAFRLASKWRMACPNCIHEDILFWGFSYWRRRHQLPGVLWCDKHRVGLIAIDQEFDVCPWIPSGSPGTHTLDILADCLENPVINRYVEIVSGFLELRRPLSFSEAAKKLSLRAQEKGIRVSAQGRRPVLSDVALNSVPTIWLSTLCPGVETKKPGERFPAIDRVLLHEGLPQARALALALMFDSAEEALSYWRGPLAEDKGDDDENALCGQDFWNSKKVLNIYVKSEGNHSETARVIGVHSRRVSGELGRCGLPSLSGIQLETTGKALLAFFEGLSLTEACAIHGAELRVCEGLIRQGGARLAAALRRIVSKRSRGGSALQNAIVVGTSKRKDSGQNLLSKKTTVSGVSVAAVE